MILLHGVGRPVRGAILFIKRRFIAGWIGGVRRRYAIPLMGAAGSGEARIRKATTGVSPPH
jgi:hypothetical protein